MPRTSNDFLAEGLKIRRSESGLPLGGIGAGSIEFCPDGRFTNVTTNNNWDSPIVDHKARIPPLPRIKEGFEGSVAENISLGVPRLGASAERDRGVRKATARVPGVEVERACVA